MSTKETTKKSEDKKRASQLKAGKSIADDRFDALINGKELSKLDEDDRVALRKFSAAQHELGDMGVSPVARLGRAVDRSTFLSSVRLAGQVAVTGGVGYLLYDKVSEKMAAKAAEAEEAEEVI